MSVRGCSVPVTGSHLGLSAQMCVCVCVCVCVCLWVMAVLLLFSHVAVPFTDQNERYRSSKLDLGNLSIIQNANTIIKSFT